VANAWTGAVNNLWGTAGNWSCGTVPDANTDVIIGSGSVVVSSNAVCRSLKVNPGATLSVATGFTISVTN
jgi:trimeric autotransporter adhesin